MKPELMCYVCGKLIKAGALYIGQNLYRHSSKCRPGSDAWLKSKVSKGSKLSKELRKLWVNYKKKEV